MPRPVSALFYTLCLATALLPWAPASEVRVWGSAEAPAEVYQVPAGLTDVIQVAAGNRYVAALRATGVVVVWGVENTFPDPSILTVPPGAQSGVVQIASGANHLLALRSDGTVVGWGDGSSNRLLVSDWSSMATVYAEAFSSAGLTTAGAVRLAGNTLPPAPSGTFAEVQSADSGVLLRDGTGAVSALTSQPPLGNFTPPAGLIARRLIPLRYGTNTNDPGMIGGAIRASDNAVILWGTDREGVLSRLPAGLTAESAILGFSHAVAVSSAGTLTMWGDGPAGDPAYLPPADLPPVSQIALGRRFTVALVPQPFVITCTPGTVAERVPTGTVIGNLATSVGSTTVPVATYTLAAGTGDTNNALVAISGSNLVVNGTIDFETQPKLSVRVRGTKSDGTYAEQALTIAVLNDSSDDPSTGGDGKSGCGLGTGLGLVLSALLAFFGLRLSKRRS